MAAAAIVVTDLMVPADRAGGRLRGHVQPLDRNPRIEADLTERMAATDFYRWSGITLEAASQGEVELSIDVRANHMNLQGMLHGGMMATLADTATGLAVRTVLEPGTRYVTVQLGVNFLAPGKPGRVVARGRVVRAGRQMAYAEADIVDSEDRLLARAQSSLAIVADDPQAGGE
jgi:uncharacterized protein (TIGR00369 family)